MEEQITISKKEYDELIKTKRKYDCLDALGVDNWGGYGMAMQKYCDEYENVEE